MNEWDAMLAQMAETALLRLQSLRGGDSRFELLCAAKRVLRASRACARGRAYVILVIPVLKNILKGCVLCRTGRNAMHTIVTCLIDMGLTGLTPYSYLT